MKVKQLIIAGTLLVSACIFAQKEELKTLKKIYGKEELKKEDLDQYKVLVDKVLPLVNEEGDKIYANFYKSMIPIIEMNLIDKSSTPLQIQAQLMKSFSPKNCLELASGLNNTLDYEKKTGKKIYTDDINDTKTSIKPLLLNYAIGLGNAKQYKESAQILFFIYQLDKKETENLYYAANYALDAQDYNLALDYFKELKAINYTGEGTLYFAKNLATEKEESFTNKSERDKLILLKSHVSPREEKVPSKKGEILKMIAQILVQQDKSDEALAALKEARVLFPDDASLILSEADIYYKKKDLESYKKSINEALEKKPNDADLLYNLGVISSTSNQVTEAENYFNKAITIDPKYTNAYLNLAELKLRGDEKLVKEMNTLTTSEKDNKRYAVLKAEREKMFKSALPNLEKAYELDPKNVDVTTTLLGVYRALEMNDKVKELKSKM